MTDQILAIYDADFTVLGEITYAVGKVIGARSCSLCDISHGFNPLGKKTWRSYCETRPEIEWVHRNDLDSGTLAALPSPLPCVVFREAADSYRTLLDSEDLSTCSGDITRFDEKLSGALAKHAATFGGAPAS